ENSRTERLAEIQQVTYESMQLFSKCLDKIFPYMENDRKQGLMLDFFTYLYGIDHFIQVSEKQEEALKRAGIPLCPITIHDAVYGFIMRNLRQEEKQ
ncbi:MAG: hypothetical protein ACI4JN_07240, partial [Ruminococcus sp.]